MSFWTKSCLLITIRTAWVTEGTHSSWWAASSSSGGMFSSPRCRSYSCLSCTWETDERHRWPSEPAYVGRRDSPCPYTYTASACQSGPPHTATSETRAEEIFITLGVLDYAMAQHNFGWKKKVFINVKHFSLSWAKITLHRHRMELWGTINMQEIFRLTVVKYYYEMSLFI